MRHLTANVDGPVSYADYGGAGPPIVLVHGIGGSHVNWILVASGLASFGHVIAPDLPGFGRSKLGRRSAAVQAQASWLSRFIAHLDAGPAVVIGHSMGGLVAMLLAAKHPESLTAMVLLDPAVSGGRSSPAPGISTRSLNALSFIPRLSNALMQPVLRRVGPERVVGDGIRRAYYDPAAVDSELLRMHVELEEERMRARGAYVGYLQAWRSMRGLARRWRQVNRDVVARITTPTLLVHGVDDPIVHFAGAESLAALRPDWDTAFLEGVGHDIQMEAPQRVLEVVTPWLERRRGAPEAEAVS